MMSCTRNSLFSPLGRATAPCRLAATACVLRRCFASSAVTAARPVRRTNVTPAERAALRAARKERASKVLEQQQQQQHLQQQTANSTAAAGVGTTRTNMAMSRYIWYLSVGVPSILLAWGFSDENSPPAKLSRAVGLTGYIRSYTDEIAKPAHTKLLPDWAHIPNVPHDIPVPHTLVLDLENTLVSSTWDRKYGWRHAKRPGVDKFLHELAQYYEIVLYSPSLESIADPVVTALDKEGCIMHRLYREATYYHNGVHVKDLNSLNRNVKRMIVLDDDPDEVQFNRENLIRVKPYNDPNDRTDRTLERITPFLVEIAREGFNDIPTLLQQYQGMDADEIADEQERRIQQLRYERQQLTQRGLVGGFARGLALPEPELSPSGSDSSHYGYAAPQQLTAKDIAGAAPTPSLEQQTGIAGWMARRAKEKEEQQMRKLEKWQEVMMKKQKEKEEAAKRA